MARRRRRREIDVLISSGGGLFRRRIIEAPRHGVTVHFIDRGVDTGDVLAFRELHIEPTDTIQSLRRKAGVLNLELFLDCVDRLADGSATRTPQQPEAGRQYYIMHSRIKRIAESKIDRRSDAGK